jgi:phosphate transport system substrate-binding protein
MDLYVRVYLLSWTAPLRGIRRPLIWLTIISVFSASVLAGCGSASGNSSTPNGHLLIVGSTALQPLATSAAGLFQKQYPQVQVEVRGGGSVTGLQSVTSQQADIGSSDIYADPALYPDPNLTDHIVCVTAFTMVVAPGVPISSLTSQQIIDIFSTGTLRNWKELDGPDLPIVPVVRPATSGTRATFSKYVLGGLSEHGQLLTTDSSTQVRDTVAHTPGAIGYLSQSVLDNSVRSIAIDGQMATAEGITSGHYPFWAYEHMYTLGATSGPIPLYLDFLQTSQIQALEQKLGYIPTEKIKLSGSLQKEAL